MWRAEYESIKAGGLYMWTSSNYYTEQRIVSVPVVEQVNMLAKHALRQGLVVLRYDLCSGIVVARISDYGSFSLACIGKWVEGDDEQGTDWGVIR